MTSPSLTNPFDPLYEQYSQWIADAYIPAHFNYYTPSSNLGADFGCLGIMQPAPELGAEVWTRNGDRILIGAYRDEGRQPATLPATNAPWAAADSTVTVATSQPHKLKTGDVVTISSLLVSPFNVVVTVTAALSFKFIVSDFVAASGTLSYFRTEPVSFYEERVVYRLLPSFRLITLSELNNIFYQTAPTRLRSQIYTASGAINTS